MDVTIIASVYNEEGNLAPLVERIVTVMERYLYCGAWELLLVNDASTDGSARILQELEDRFPDYLRILHHPQRRGQKGCFMTGFASARGRFSILMDADLQVLPEELPRLLDAALLERHEMVCTYNDIKRGGKRRHIISHIGNLVMRMLFHSPVRNAGANLMAVETRYVRGVRLVANDQRYLLPIAMRRGLRHIAEVGCVFALRAYGRSKYSYWKKMVGGIPEMLMLKRRLVRGDYDLPPVPPSECSPHEPSNESLRCADVKDLADWLSQPLLSQEARAAFAALTSQDHVWSIAGERQPFAVVAWRHESWDSDILGIPTGRIHVTWSAGTYLEQYHRLTKALSAALADLRHHGLSFVSLRIAEEQVAAVRAAEHAGFQLVESYLTFTGAPQRVTMVDPRVRLAQAADADDVADLAARAFRYHRYLNDPLIPEQQARETRRQWVLNAFRGRADAIYVAMDEGSIAGFMLLRSVRRPHGTVGVIDLLAVREQSRGLGLGGALVRQALQHYAGQVVTVEVGTQGKNLSAIHLYTKHGFQLQRVDFSLHWHREGMPAIVPMTTSTARASDDEAATAAHVSHEH